MLLFNEDGVPDSTRNGLQQTSTMGLRPSPQLTSTRHSGAGTTDPTLQRFRPETHQDCNFWMCVAGTPSVGSITEENKGVWVNGSGIR